MLSSTALPIRKSLVCYRPAIRKLEWSEYDPASGGPGHGWPLSGIIILIQGDPNHPIDKPVIFSVGIFLQFLMAQRKAHPMREGFTGQLALEYIVIIRGNQLVNDLNG